MAYYTNETGGSVEVFHYSNKNKIKGLLTTGWYWWPCSPGCLPDNDGDSYGPFETEEQAKEDALNG